jgi:hypothetical protein
MINEISFISHVKKSSTSKLTYLAIYKKDLQGNDNYLYIRKITYFLYLIKRKCHPDFRLKL